MAAASIDLLSNTDGVREMSIAQNRLIIAYVRPL